MLMTTPVTTLVMLTRPRARAYDALMRGVAGNTEVKNLLVAAVGTELESAEFMQTWGDIKAVEPFPERTWEVLNSTVMNIAKPMFTRKLVKCEDSEFADVSGELKTTR